MTWERTNNFQAPTTDGRTRFEAFHRWLDNDALCLLENEDGVMIVCHMDDVKAVEASLKQSGHRSLIGFFRPKGFNHGVYEVEYSGDEKPSAQDVIDAAMKFAGSDKIYFTISQRIVDYHWENWRRYGHCEFSLSVLRHDGRSYLHG